MNKCSVAVIAPHPDDETLGCGGTLLAHKQRGDTLHWIVATGLAGAGPEFEHRTETREKEIKAVAGHYGFSSVLHAGFPTAALDKIGNSELITKFRQFFEKTQPEVLYLPYPHDIHTDHKHVFDAAVSASKWFRQGSVRRILAYETLSETDFAPFYSAPTFSPNVYVDISKHLDRKIQIMQTYHGELGEHPFPRSPESIRALATLRGAQAGCVAAEAFLLVREVHRLEG